MTVTENLELGAWLAQKADRKRRVEEVLANFPKLRERANQLAGTMSGGEQQMVAVARAMMSHPRLLMLDEPSLGLAPRLVDEVLAMTRRIADAGTTVLMVEQNVKKALGWPAVPPGCSRDRACCARPISVAPIPNPQPPPMRPTDAARRLPERRALHGGSMPLSPMKGETPCPICRCSSTV